MYVEPSHRGSGAGSALLDGLIAAAGEAGYARLRLDNPDFMTDAHRLYLRRGFEPIEPYAESEIPVNLRAWWVSWSGPSLGGDDGWSGIRVAPPVWCHQRVRCHVASLYPEPMPVLADVRRGLRSPSA